MTIPQEMIRQTEKSVPLEEAFQRTDFFEKHLIGSK
jgi:hypothetical protein